MTAAAAAPPPPRRGGLWLAWLGAFALFLGLAHGNLESLDSTITMHAAKALVQRGDSGLRGPAQDPQWPGEARIAAYVANEAARGVHAYGKLGRNGLTYVWFPMGHVWLMAPCVWLGERLQVAFPELEQRFRRATAASPQSQQFGEFVLDHAMVALLLPPLCGATLLVVLFLLARALGAPPRQAALAAAVVLFASQAFPCGRETLSDGPGLVALLAALLAVVRVHGGAGAGTAALGGLLSGAAVLARYPHGLLVPALGLAVVLAAWRRRQPRLVVAFAAGGLPALMLLAAVNQARFGAVGDTGYPPFGSWFNYPVWFGVTKLLVAAGKGILWFSPLVWLAGPALLRRGQVPELRWLAAVLFAVPMLLFGSTNGWQSGQCWGARYVTPGVVALLALVLPQLRPWQRTPRTFWALVAFGVLANVTSVVAPTRGHNQLAGQAVEAMYDRELAAGRIQQLDRDNLDPADHYFFLPRFSPLHAHWSYLGQSLRGAFEDAAGAPRDGSQHTIEPLFGIAAAPGHEAAQGRAPLHWEDRHSRHLAVVFWGELLGVAPLWLWLPVVLAAAVLSWAGWRRVLGVDFRDTR